MFVFQFNYNEVFDWDDKTFKVSVESNSEAEKGSNKLVLTLPNSEPKTYSSNWYFNYNDFKKNGNTVFIISDYYLLCLSSEISDIQVNNTQWIGKLYIVIFFTSIC